MELSLTDNGYQAMALDANSKLEEVRKAMKAGDWDEAIRLTAKFGDLGKYGEPITRAKEAINNPEFYRQLGYDLEQIRIEGILALREKFSHSWNEILKETDYF